MIEWTCLLFLTILFSQSSLYSTDYVHQYTAGSLSDSWSINFTISTDEVKGVILQIFDSRRNQFGMQVTRVNNGTQVRINYNGIYRLAPLSAPNKCRSCDVTKMKCGVRLRNGMVAVWSNRFDPQSFSAVDDNKSSDKDENSDIRVRPLPKTMTNRSETLYIMIGNIGPYVSEDGTVFYPTRDQLEGCVEIFTYNDRRISLRENGTKLRSSCTDRCRDNICNGGLCHERSNSSVLCDCSSTALNGPFCDRGLMKYVPGSNNSLEKVKEAHEVHLKMTWRHLLDKVYCLMDIVTGYKHAKISINKSHLMINLVNISDISIHGVNFITVTIANNRLVVKTRRGEHEVEFAVDTTVTINVGFSERSDKTCETFEGAYDLHFSSSQLRLVQYSTNSPTETLTSKRGETTALSNMTTTESALQNGNSPLSEKVLIIACTSVALLSLVIFVVVILVLHLKNNKKMEDQIRKIIAYSVFSLDTANDIFTETGLYDKVESSYHYDSIQDTEYTVIDEV